MTAILDPTICGGAGSLASIIYSGPRELPTITWPAVRPTYRMAGN